MPPRSKSAGDAPGGRSPRVAAAAPDASGAHLSEGRRDRDVDVGAMFDRIAPRYDLLNTVLSFGADRAWRRAARNEAVAVEPSRMLDVATGTGDLAFELARARPGAEVVGVDVSERMLDLARAKGERRGRDVEWRVADGASLPFETGSFDVVTIAFGLRNFADADRGLRELLRVLRPGGRLVVLEFPPPPPGAFGRLFGFYFRRILPPIGGWISGDREAYRYLPESASRFPSPERLVAKMHAAGFARVRHRNLTFGISALHVADAPPEEERP